MGAVRYKSIARSLEASKESIDGGSLPALRDPLHRGDEHLLVPVTACRNSESAPPGSLNER